MPSPVRTRALDARVLLLGLGATWGSSYVLISIALRDLSAPAVAFGRQAIAALVLAPLALAVLRRPEVRRRWPALVAVAVVTVGAPSLLVAAGQRDVNASLAGILVATSPVLTALLALRLDRGQRSEGPRLVGVVLGMAGIVALFGLDLTGSRETVVGGALLLLASLGYAVGPFLLRRSLPDVPALPLVACTSAVSALLLLPAAAPALPLDDVGAGPALAVAGLGLGGTAVGWWIFYSLVQREGPRTAAVAQYLAPAFAVLLGVSLLGEPVTAGIAVGLPLVLAGSWLAAAPVTPAAGPRRSRR